jgi:hypothetical protein
MRSMSDIRNPSQMSNVTPYLYEEQTYTDVESIM